MTSRATELSMAGLALAGLLLAVLAAACGDDRSGYTPGPAQTEPEYTEDRQPCADRNPHRNLYFGDLHVHTGYSFDAFAHQTRLEPQDAYRFARGQSVLLPPLDESGAGTRQVQLDRPLDFAAVTDHAEYFGETSLCADPDSPVYSIPECVELREEGRGLDFGLRLAAAEPERFEAICGSDGERCLARSSSVWERVQEAADNAYDRSGECSFTSFVAYEYTNARRGNGNHRNVIFRNRHVPERALSAIDEPEPARFREWLQRECIEADDCDALAIPHNSNQSGGEMFAPASPDRIETRRDARLRRDIEPLVEIYQAKGSSECSIGLPSFMNAPDELCDFELLAQPPVEDCGEGLGFGGITGAGCTSRYDFVREALALGLRFKEELGANPFKLGIIASTDTHSAVPGATSERDWPGHRGAVDATPTQQLEEADVTEGVNANRVVTSPGGLAGVWAVENSRDAIFEALRRRETFGTSGTRMSVRVFGGWDLPADICERGNLVELGYQHGVPMGSDLPPRTNEAPSFAVLAAQDPGTAERPGTPLQRVQIIKGSMTDSGQPEVRVFEVAGDPDNGATVDPETCEQSGAGATTLCGTWTDPEFDPNAEAFYYVRVLENPSCRWSTLACNGLAGDERPAACDDPAVPRTIQERAWSSPIWYSR